jgi:hypothetical protein
MEYSILESLEGTDSEAILSNNHSESTLHYTTLRYTTPLYTTVQTHTARAATASPGQ